jgi:hypothetical protein
MRHTAASFVEVDVNALQLLLCVRATVLSLRIDPMLLGYRLPELEEAGKVQTAQCTSADSKARDDGSTQRFSALKHLACRLASLLKQSSTVKSGCTKQAEVLPMVRAYLPTNLIAALANLEMDYFPHFQ